jgi:hypothetical protein
MKNIAFAKTIGRLAYESLAPDQEAILIGLTSRGLFVRIGEGRVIFLSFETWRGPLTLSLTEEIAELRTLEHGTPVRITPGQLIFPDAGVAVAVHPEAVWQQPPPSHPARPVAERLDNLHFFASQIALAKNGQGFSGLLPPLLGLPTTTEPDEEPLLATLLGLRQALRNADVPASAETIGKLLGMGSGLTPSGDDVVVGLLLALNRWRPVLWPGGDLGRLNALVVEAAYKATTTLSANLIECAAQGESDERLVAALDSIVTGHPPTGECVPLLLGWGNSSGADALVGMTLALTI